MPQLSVFLLNLKYIYLLNNHYYIIIVKQIELYIQMKKVVRVIWTQ